MPPLGAGAYNPPVMHPAKLLLALTVGAAALTLAACGSGAGPAASAQTGSGPGPGAVSFAKCMRTHGVPEFPDPGGSGVPLRARRLYEAAPRQAPPA